MEPSARWKLSVAKFLACAMSRILGSSMRPLYASEKSSHSFSIPANPWLHGGMAQTQINVLGQELQSCSLDPLTGYYRTGCCENHGDDPGVHVVCVVMT